jgi:hypothetical protein
MSTQPNDNSSQQRSRRPEDFSQAIAILLQASPVFAAMRARDAIGAANRMLAAWYEVAGSLSMTSFGPLWAEKNLPETELRAGWERHTLWHCHSCKAFIAAKDTTGAALDLATLGCPACGRAASLYGQVLAPAPERKIADDVSYLVNSRSQPGRKWNVRHDGERWVCDCPGFTWRERTHPGEGYCFHTEHIDKLASSPQAPPG